MYDSQNVASVKGNPGASIEQPMQPGGQEENGNADEESAEESAGDDGLQNQTQETINAQVQQQNNLKVKTN